MKPLLITFAAIPSTQDWVRRWAHLGAEEGLTVQALAQTAGRGRLEREWWSPAGDGLYLSVLLRPALPLSDASQLTMLVCLAAIDACQECAGLRPRPKWPNDLLLGGRKLAGVLAEVEQDNGLVRSAILGLGLNVSTRFAGTPLSGSAASLSEMGGRSLTVTQVRDAYLEALASRYARLQQGESPFAAWRQNLSPLGQRVAVLQAGQADLVGEAFDVHPQGALLVRDDQGAVHTVWAGDVQVLTAG